MPNVRIPKRFYDDHLERDLPAPPIKAWRGGYVINTDHRDFAELMDDAKHYATDGCDCEPGLKRAAQVLIKTVKHELAFIAHTKANH